MNYDVELIHINPLKAIIKKAMNKTAEAKEAKETILLYVKLMIKDSEERRHNETRYNGVEENVHK